MMTFLSRPSPKEWEMVRWRNGQTWFSFFLFLYPHRIWGKTYLGFFCVCATTLFYVACYISKYVCRCCLSKIFSFQWRSFFFRSGKLFPGIAEIWKNFRNNSFQNSGRREEETEIGALRAPRLGQQLINAQGVIKAWLKIQVQNGQNLEKYHNKNC